jgi:hypothetical protein
VRIEGVKKDLLTVREKGSALSSVIARKGYSIATCRTRGNQDV